MNGHWTADIWVTVIGGAVVVVASIVMAVVLITCKLPFTPRPRPTIWLKVIGTLGDIAFPSFAITYAVQQIVHVTAPRSPVEMVVGINTVHFAATPMLLALPWARVVPPDLISRVIGKDRPKQV